MSKAPVNLGRRFQRLELTAKKREYDVTFRIQNSDGQATGRVKVTCKGMESPRETFERECCRYGHTNWRYLSAEEIDG